ncbi:MAG: hypothetical protein F6K28_26700 [Microcoleus sp. SIO2G3]|nr:hypothetical protein [Microcoleus sp. SIO2G3]
MRKSCSLSDRVFSRSQVVGSESSVIGWVVGAIASVGKGTIEGVGQAFARTDIYSNSYKKIPRPNAIAITTTYSGRLTAQLTFRPERSAHLVKVNPQRFNSSCFTTLAGSNPISIVTAQEPEVRRRSISQERNVDEKVSEEPIQTDTDLINRIKYPKE